MFVSVHSLLSKPVPRSPCLTGFLWCVAWQICGAELMHRREAVAMLTRQLAEDALLCLSLCTLAFCAANIPWLLGFYAYQLLTMR